ncbi:hypothetical protein SLS56_010407 [Neofusicoccum ribis]|uniref:Myb-like domain-containing protein n=1 Tax=Neofusicoccum ribis TaxID=45134 RepID=A0ABR3SEH3_9PEZI
MNRPRLFTGRSHGSAGHPPSLLQLRSAASRKMSAASDTDWSLYDGTASAQAEDAAEERADFSARDSQAGGNESPEPPFNLEGRKRKNVGNFQNRRSKKLKGLYRDEYRKLFNATIAETTSFVSASNPGRLQPSQLGVSKWSVAEKQRLFSAIERYGKDNMPKITSIVRTKSEPEIREFLCLLQEGVAEVHINAEYTRAPALHEIPAAHEISGHCCKTLESAADALARYQDSWDTKQEQKKHGDYWLLTPNLAAEFDKAIEKEEASPYTHDDQGTATSEPAQDEEPVNEETEEELEHASAALDVVPAARLLWLSNWFELLDRVFANAGGPREDENWRSAAEPDEELGIFHTAFSDFHRLVVSITQRLVAASLHQACSRLRAKDKHGDSHSAKPLVRRQDVVAAIEVLSMPHSAKEFWIKAPRRCGVMVQLHGKFIHYDQVERILSGNLLSHATSGSARETAADDGVTENDFHAPGDYTSSEESDEDSLDLDSKQEAYADQFDRKESHQEEARLWRCLGHSPPPTVNIKVELPKRPHVDRKFGDELADWRDVVDFKTEWERYERPVDPAKFKNIAPIDSARREQRFEAPIKTAGPPESDGDSISPALGSGNEGEESEDDSVGIQARENEVEDDEDGGVHPSTLPIRRVLAPRRARDAATSSMGELPPYPDNDDSSGDDYDGRSQQDSE